MKLRSLILTIMLTGFAGSISVVYAQAPESFVYQGEARDKTGMILDNQDLSIRATLLTGPSLTGSSTVWTKDYYVTTNDYGLFTLEVGDAAGEVAFAAINWGIGKYFLNIRVLSGNGWLDMGTTQLLSVPYALYAKSAGSVRATETDPIFIASASAGISWNHLENWNLAYSWGDHSAQGYLKGFTETDPFYKASPSSGITGTQIANWNLAYGWGDHAAQGYLKSFAETDPFYRASPSAGISATNIANWNAAYGWGNHASAGYLKSYTESDPIFAASPSNSITTTNIGNWNLAYGWGNHASAGYLKSYTETDPIFVASPSNGITTTNIGNWNLSYGWGNHASAGYLTSYTETDPIFVASPSNGITTTNIGNWNVAYGWGNHASAGYLTSYTETDPIFLASPSNGITTTNIGNWNAAYGWGNHASAGYLTSYSETDPIFAASPSKNITTTFMANWDSAYSWGDHAGLYRGATWVPSWSEVGGKPFWIDDSPLNGDLLWWDGGIGRFINWTPNFLTAETDPVWTAAVSSYYTKDNLKTSGSAQVHFNNLTNKPTTLTGYGITDAMSTSHAANAITTTNIQNWNEGIWSKNGNDLYYSGGKVGIGTSDPSSLLVSPLNVEGGVKYSGSGSPTPGLLYYDASGSGTFRYYDNTNTSQVLGTGTINYTGTLWTAESGDYLSGSGVDVLVRSSLAVGYDAVAGESFDFATIMLKENNTRIRFYDTSGSGFPSNDWQLTANDNTSGGQNYFAIEDFSNSTFPFKVMAGAPTNSVHISSAGKVGFGLATPARKIHVNDAIRLEPTTEPTDPAQGDLYFDSTTKKLRCYDGTTWHDLW